MQAPKTRSSVARGGATPTLDAAAPPPLERTGGAPDVGRVDEAALGLLDSLDTPVHEFYPEWSEEPYSGITVRHLLNHTSGLESPMPTDPIYASDGFVRFALESDLETSPGEEMVYNNCATNLLAGLVGEAAGSRLDRFLGEELFGPMGITDFSWSLDDAGNPHGMAGFQVRPEDLARLGQLRCGTHRQSRNHHPESRGTGFPHEPAERLRPVLRSGR